MKNTRKLSLICLVSVICIGLTISVYPNQAAAKKIELSLANEAPPFFIYTIISKKFKELIENMDSNHFLKTSKVSLIKKAYQIYQQEGLQGIRRRITGNTIMSYFLIPVSCIVSPFIGCNWKFLREDLISVYRDIRQTQRIRKIICHLENQGTAQSINKLSIKNYKKSDTIFILGSGSSVNDLTEENWMAINRHDSIGFNYWLIHEFVPTFYFIEPSAYSERFQAVLDLLRRRSRECDKMPIICEYKNWYNSGRTFQQIPTEVEKNAYLYAPYYLRTRLSKIVSAFLRYGRFIGFFGNNNVNSIIHHRATLSATVMFAVIGGYQNIVLTGIDLNSSSYFWEDKPEKYRNQSLPRNIQSSNIHRTVDPDATDEEKAIPIDKYLDILDRVVLQPNGIKVFMASKKSKLYPRFPLYPAFNIS